MLVVVLRVLVPPIAFRGEADLGVVRLRSTARFPQLLTQPLKLMSEWTRKYVRAGALLTPIMHDNMAWGVMVGCIVTRGLW